MEPPERLAWATPWTVRAASSAVASTSAARSAASCSSSTAVTSAPEAIASAHQAGGGCLRRAIGGIAQQRLADALAEDAGLAARRAEDRPAALVAPRVAVVGTQPA